MICGKECEESNFCINYLCVKTAFSPQELSLSYGLYTIIPLTHPSTRTIWIDTLKQQHVSALLTSHWLTCTSRLSEIQQLTYARDEAERQA